jgi:hypothetical protein
MVLSSKALLLGGLQRRSRSYGSFLLAPSHFSALHPLHLDGAQLITRGGIVIANARAKA